ncbi:histidine kinase [Pleurocapsa sp. CCALA 161]|nr:histidine kinase [Pleurocapsa sp. CCALA 161]
MMPVEAVDLGLSINNMVKPKNQLFCRLDGLTPIVRQEQRLATLNELGLMVPQAVPILEETTQKAASFAHTPISILGLVVEDELWFKSAVGLSAIDLTNQLATQRKISLQESFSTYVIDSQQPLSIANTLNNATFTNSILTQHYGIRAYLGVPLVTASGVCIGTLEVMDWVAREFNDRDIDYLALLARWCLGEFELNRMLENQPSLIRHSHQSWWQSDKIAGASLSKHQLAITEQAELRLDPTRTSPIKLKLLSQLTEELKTPLTSVIGMASVLHREVYGPLTVKQKEYLEIIHDSGQNLIGLVDEIVNLGILSDSNSEIKPTTVDIEMLCQQVINSLEDLSKQHQQTLKLSIEPGNRLWTLDNDKIRQALHYLVASILAMSEPGGEIQIHVSQRSQALNITVSISHPWLGNDFSEAKLYAHGVTKALSFNQNSEDARQTARSEVLTPHTPPVLTSLALMMVVNDENTLDKSTHKIPRDILGLLFSCYLIEMHGGKIVVQGSPSSGYRYLLQVPPAKSIN